MDINDHISRISVAPFKVPGPTPPSYLEGDGKRSDPVAVPKYAQEKSEPDLTALKQKIDILQAQINGASISLTTVCNPDGSVTNTAGIIWGA